MINSKHEYHSSNAPVESGSIFSSIDSFLEYDRQSSQLSCMLETIRIGQAYTSLKEVVRKNFNYNSINK